ncbi:DNA topoisomerase IV subunit A [Borreliella garinii]|uniref:DNA topoisomerase IV subunit A n=1 Tax=Borreliella garinii TaxID=29519 RepID=UPI00018E26AD|nr:DNA topoisomerase IV subunit A [Borreliella garinii]EED30101.1 DNA gyrase/topoisomerase IV, A subunit domain protein [Borreliella garinii Far04]WNZ66283.1 DNA topoisomerase IV subunit A [Borreliella garinii]WNZ67279.1 DNA topoisomerase IV subunit A [Borreliella garinii]WNZ68276.1 DNA topoisomerase IV subunit A [Borreliella garinii]WNZ69276.1 DNA topoisomerase IV subunit A [Borreliella garinii]
MDIRSILKDNFLQYSSYVIKDRAIASIVDGFKPVQRRIIHSLFEMHDGNFHKVANVVGNTMKYHPHGDTSIYEALVNIANKDLFIEKQGNFGNLLTGDPASASRYIECRLTPLAFDVLYSKEITVYESSYDGRNNEPLLYPAKIPVILIQGSEGIAVGMAAKILPHNFNEILSAVKSELLGETYDIYPDFPTGGIVDVNEYADGNGKVLVRAKIETIDEKTIVIRELPFGETTESLISSIEKAIRKNYIKVSSINDFTAENVAIELSLPRGVYASEVIEKLYHYTNCQISISVNLLLLSERYPVVYTIKDLIKFHADHLQKILKMELELQRNKIFEKIFYKTLEQIFIEKKIYKLLETISKEGNIVSIILSEVLKYKESFSREVLKEDVENLLKIPIRKISLFDIDKNSKDIKILNKELKSVNSNISSIRGYSINFIDLLLSKYSKYHQRKTEISLIKSKNVKEIATKNMKVYLNLAEGFVGTSLFDGEFIGNASYYDKILVFRKNSYVLKNIEDKAFIDKKNICALVYDINNSKEQIFSIIYLNKLDNFYYIKRFKIDKFITDKVYEFLGENDEFVDFSLNPQFVEFSTNKNIVKRIEIANFMVKSRSSIGKRISSNNLKKVKFK